MMRNESAWICEEILVHFTVPVRYLACIHKVVGFVVFYFGFYSTISEFRVAHADVNNE
jgi:hypothetical protein